MDIIDINAEKRKIQDGELPQRSYGIFMKTGRTFNFNGYRRPGTYMFMTVEGDFLAFAPAEIEAVTEGEPEAPKTPEKGEVKDFPKEEKADG